MKYLIPPWNHQLEAIGRATAPNSRDFAFLFDMGTGKTSTTINTLRHRYAEAKRIMRTLILCPVVVCVNWKREFKAHSMIGDQVHILAGSQKKRLQQFLSLKDQRPAPIIVTNYEALQMKELLQEILNWRPEVLVCDESQRLKNPQATRTKMATLIADLTQHNYILSGTPILNTPMDIFAQYRILDRGETFGRNFYTFRARYFEDQNSNMPAHIHFPKFKIREGVFAELHEMIYRKGMRVMKNECLDLPDLLKETIEISLSPKQLKHYEEMKEEFITFLDQGDACTAQVAITKALRLQQIVSGYLKTEQGEEVSVEENPRLDALEELLEDIAPHHKVIVWATFHENYAQIAGACQKLKLPYTELHGGVSGKDRQGNIDRFQTDPACRVMIANQGAGGVGVNLTAASYSIFYSRNFSLEQDLQAEARNYRGGSEIHPKITRIDLVAKGTIDEVILEALANKFNLSEQILALRNKL